LASTEKEASMKFAAAMLMPAIVTIGLAFEAAASESDAYKQPPFGIWNGEQQAGQGVPLLGYLWGSNLSPQPRYGCYFTRARMNNAWRRVEVCY
jgi:hypothetical protein